ncbi:ClpP/crotonase-like domain-containing protein [Zopfochytrium polystomum]|nr:ClpP/crotonase-like domain-containing protein [Zopfochytrium polystomum]
MLSLSGPRLLLANNPFSRRAPARLLLRSSSCSFSSSGTSAATTDSSSLLHPGIAVCIDDDKIAHVALSSPPVNALTPTLLESLRVAVRGLPAAGAKGFILSSTSQKVFSAGLDLNLLLKGESESYAEFFTRTRAYVAGLQEAARELLSSDLPSVAMVEGAAPAGGTVMSLCCDYRVSPQSSPNFFIGLNETQVGMSPPAWVLELAKLAVTSRRADLFLQRGTLFNSPQEAHSVGFLDALVENRDQMRSRAVAEIREFWQAAWLARADAKRIAREPVLAAMTEEGLDQLAASISGAEFQRTVAGIRERLRTNRGKKGSP